MANSPALIAYLRVSTDKQGESGLGLEAQQVAIEAFARMTGARIVATFTEIESGANDDRAQLTAAMNATRLYKARLVVATLDRLSRDAHFVLGIAKQGVDFVAADNANASALETGFRALFAQEERRKISERTRNALTAAKARGVTLGGYRGTPPTPTARTAAAAAKRATAVDFASLVIAHVDRNATLQSNADNLNAKGITTPRGGRWTATAVSRVLTLTA